MITIFVASAAYATLFLALAAAAARLLRHSAAALRHLVWSIAIAASVLAPVLLFLGTIGVFRALGIVRPMIDVPWPFLLPPLPFRARTVVIDLWLAGLAAAFARAVLASAAVRWRTFRSSRVDDAQWRELEGAAASSLGVTRTVSVRSGEGDVPFTIGLLQPAICLPAGAPEWPRERARFVLLHELAHVARYDAATQFIERVAIVLFWFHPLMWLAVRAARRERERACDDLVVEKSGHAIPYAATLLALASEDRSSRAGELAIGACDVEARITAILDPSTPRRPARLVDELGAVVVTCALGFLTLLFGAGPARRIGSFCDLGNEPSLAAFRDAGTYYRINRWRACTEIVAIGGVGLDPRGAIRSMPAGSRLLMQTVREGRTDRIEAVPGSISCRTNRGPVPADRCASITSDAMFAFRNHHELLPRR